MLNLRTILHPTDFSQPAMYAFGVARTLAQSSGAELVIVHVAPREYRPKRRLRRERYEALSRLSHAEPTLRMQYLLLEGAVASQIVGSAVELDCDLIVMGTNGHTGARRLILGSVAADVRRDAPCPVAAVQLPKRTGWELPEFANPESFISAGPELVRGGRFEVARRKHGEDAVRRSTSRAHQRA